MKNIYNHIAVIPTRKNSKSLPKKIDFYLNILQVFKKF